MTGFGFEKNNEYAHIIDVPLIEREGVVDSNNETISKESLMQAHGCLVPVLVDFDFNKHVGNAELYYVSGKGLGARIAYVHKDEINGLFPCLMFRASNLRKKKNYSEYSGKFEVVSIGLCENNVDVEIEPINVDKMLIDKQDIKHLI